LAPVPFLLAEVRVASLTVGIERGSPIARVPQARRRRLMIVLLDCRIIEISCWACSPRSANRAYPDQEHSGAVGDGHKLVTASACCSSA